MLLTVLILLLSFAVVVWSADRFVFGAAALARNLGISPLLIGLTIVAMGSSAPEMMVAAAASWNGNTDTAVGNVIGSNITNIALVLGLVAIIRPLSIHSGTLRREMPLLLLVTLLAGWILYDGFLGHMEGVLLAVLFFAVIGGIAWYTLKNGDPSDPLVEEEVEEVPEGVKTPVALFWLVLGMALLPLSSDYLVGAAIDIAHALGVSDLVIGLTIIAIGTSLPELAASVAGVMKKADDLALGNIIGSNLFNILAVMALPGLILPSQLDPAVMARDYPWMLAITLALLVLAYKPKSGGVRSIGRLAGVGLLLAFVVYQFTLFYNQAG
ncbi:calcium/sodium antiporter [Gallaecimonas sp. GXIMD4217]|uniref:calcium/sodium antiporter n=1 Tax=Gallaecimonas sp. GXIMD4217 TaxID=3131927 RepID=UPI00311AEB95